MTAAYASANDIMGFERSVHLAWEPWLQERIVTHDVLVTLANWTYIWAHWPVIITIAVVLFRCERRRYRLLRNAMLISGAIGFLFFAFLPVAPPRLAEPGLVDTVTLQLRARTGALQPPGLTDQFAALPSLHFGWNLLAGIAVWGATTNIALRTLSVVGPAAMAAAVVVTANHYVIDVLAGLVVVLVGLAADRVIDGRPVRSAADGFPHRPSRRERPGGLPAGGDAGLRPHRGRPTGVARAGRDPAPEDPRADPAPVGPVGTRQSARASPGARSAPRCGRPGH